LPPQYSGCKKRFQGGFGVSRKLQLSALWEEFPCLPTITFWKKRGEGGIPRLREKSDRPRKLASRSLKSGKKPPCLPRALRTKRILHSRKGSSPGRAAFKRGRKVLLPVQTESSLQRGASVGGGLQLLWGHRRTEKGKQPLGVP